MRSKYSNIAILIAAILSFLPALAAGYVVDSYARARMTTAVQRAADDIGADIEANADDAIAMRDRDIETLADLANVLIPRSKQREHRVGIGKRNGGFVHRATRRVPGRGRPPQATRHKFLGCVTIPECRGCGIDVAVAVATTN